MALFQPDRHSGGLGYVVHGYNPKNVYQVMANFFIWTAPLVGGTLAMFALLWLFYPSAANRAIGDEAGGDALAQGQIGCLL